MAHFTRPDEPADLLHRLAERVQDGEQGAFEELVSRFTPGLRRLLLRRANGRVDVADELAHETWIAVWKVLRAGRYDRQRAAISTFIYAVAHKLWLQHLRRVTGASAFRGGSGELSEAAGTGENPAGALQAAEMLDALRACLHATDTPLSLTDEERQIVTGLVSGETERTLAARLGVAASTVHVRKQQAYRKLSRCLAAKGFSTESIERRDT